MSRRVYPVFVIGVALAMLCVLGWRAFAPADAGAPPPLRDADAGTAASAALGTPPPAATGEPIVNAARIDAASGAPQSRLRILDETRAPVANAEVAFDLADDLLRTWQPLAFDVEERLATAPRYRSASDGIVTLPTDAARAFVLARAGERLGHARVEFDSWLYEIPELTIAPDRSLRVAVVSPRGEPRPNVPVEVTLQEEEALAGPGTGTRLLPRTGPDGTTTLWHAQTLSFWNVADSAVELRAFVLGATPPAHRVTLADPVPERIVLECPDHGGIRVRASGGRAVSRGDPLQPRLGEEGTDLLPQPSLLMPGATPVEACVFPVALGKNWSVGPPGYDVHSHLMVSVAGPVRHGDEVLVELPQQISGLCTVRLLQPDGRPCALHPIELDRDSQPRQVETDAQGCLTVTVVGGGVTFHSRQLHASARVGVTHDPNAAGPTDLGTVQLEAQALLAAGRIVDAGTGGPVQAFAGAERVAGDRLGESLARGFAGADGGFELWGESAARFKLWVAKEGYTKAELELAPGTRDLVVLLQPLRLLRATVLLDATIAIEDLSVLVYRGDDWRIWSEARIEGGRFHAMFELPDGDDLVLVVAGVDGFSPLRRVPMAQWTQANGVFATTVDLRGELASVLVAVRQGDPEAPTYGSLYMKPTGSPGPWAEVVLAPRIAFAAPIGAVFDAIARPGDGACVRTTLRTGANTIDVPAAAVAQIEVTGVPAGVARASIAVLVYRLVRREPLLEELVIAGVEGLDDEVRNWPRTAADLPSDENEGAVKELGDGPIGFQVRRRGSYVAVPFVGPKGHRVPLLDAATAIEITTPGQVVEATIRLDPEKVRAALR